MKMSKKQEPSHLFVGNNEWRTIDQLKYLTRHLTKDGKKVTNRNGKCIIHQEKNSTEKQIENRILEEPGKVLHLEQAETLTLRKRNAWKVFRCDFEEELKI